jgi:hypothetical protein
MDLATQLQANLAAAHVKNMCRIVSSSLQNWHLVFPIHPTTLAHIIFGSYGIMPNEPKPNFDLQRNFCFPQMFEDRSIPLLQRFFCIDFTENLPFLVHFQIGLSLPGARATGQRILFNSLIWS